MSTDEVKAASIDAAYTAADVVLDRVEAVAIPGTAALTLLLAGMPENAGGALLDMTDEQRSELATAATGLASLCVCAGAQYVIWSNQQRAWWGPGEAGYTRYVEEAGRYTETDARRIVAQATVAGQLVHRVTGHLTGADVEVLDEVMLPAPVPVVRACRVCGCTEDRACEGGCSWAEPDLCSACWSAP